jgi:hypothetical protein
MYAVPPSCSNHTAVCYGLALSLLRCDQGMINLDIIWACRELEERAFQTWQFDDQRTPFRRIKQPLEVCTHIGDSPNCDGLGWRRQPGFQVSPHLLCEILRPNGLRLTRGSS